MGAWWLEAVVASYPGGQPRVTELPPRILGTRQGERKSQNIATDNAL